MPDAPETRRLRRAHQRRKSPLVKRVWFWVPVAVVLLIIVVGVVALTVGKRALAAKDDLEGAIPLAHTVEQQILAGNQDAATKTAAQLQQKTTAARKASSGRLWRDVEWVPVVGPNLEAVRILSAAVDGLAQDAVMPATKINVDAFKPVNGRINIEALRALGSTIDSTKEAITTAKTTIGTIDEGQLVGQVKTGITKLDATLDSAASLIDGAQRVVKVLPGALGLDGTRHYLMIFEGNSEVRALGGNPAAMALIQASDGKITIAKQYSSSDFQNARATSVAPLDPAVEHIYSDIIGRWIPNITSTPDFPTTVKLMSAYFDEVNDTRLDGIISFDPVALSYLLKAAGPVKLPTGQTLTAANAVPLLLNQVYFDYPNPKVQNAFFAAAAASVFGVLTSGNTAPQAMIPALVRATNEGRLMFWSENKAEEKIVKGTRLAGILPFKNDKTTVIGAYFNDVTGSKMDYYVKAKASATSTQCTADAPKFTETVTLSNVLDPSKASSLPAYITGPYYTPGDIGTDVVVYGPVGAKIDSWKASKSAKVKATGTIDGRPVSRILVKLAPGESATLTYTMSGAKGKYGPLEMRTTPMVWPTPTTVSSPGCEAGK